jgi:hypothetical protein
MLDVNNENLSSESAENNINEEKKKAPLDPKEIEKEESEKESDSGDNVSEVKVESEIEVQEDDGEIEVSEEKGKADEIVTVEAEVKDTVEVEPLEKEVEVETEEVVDEKIEAETTAAVEEKVEAESKEEVDEKVEAETTAAVEEKVEAESKEEVDEKVEAETTELVDEKVDTPVDKGEELDVKEKEVKKEIPHFDISKLSMEEVVEAIYLLLNEFEIKEVKNQIESLKSDFQKKFKAKITEKKKAFLEEGGNEIDFFYASPTKEKFDILIREYKKRRQQIYKDIEREQKENLEIRLNLIDELKGLIDNADGSTMYKNFKALQDKWREVGQIPHSKYNDVWRTFHHHVERFYDLLHLNNDFRDLDFKHNLEEKTKLVDRAEELAENEDVNYAFKELQLLHKMWKEDIGPVARELREDIWQRFSEATRQIHQKKHEYQDKLDEKYKANVDLKLAVIEKIKNVDTGGNDSHKTWQANIKKVEALRDEFFAIGKVPKSKNEEIWQLFRESTKRFNSAKNAFYKNIKKGQSENLEKKLLLVKEAESMKDSEDWKEATEFFKKVQADWKKIGHVPRRDSDKIWKRFKDACNHYFDRLHDKVDDLGKDQSELIEKKKEFIENLKAEIEKGKELTLEFIQESLNNWREIGVLPQKVRHLDAKFNKVIDSAYKKLDISKTDADFLRFESGMNSLLDQKNARKLDSEQLYIRRKIDEITREIKQLENNISFISNASEDNPLVKNVYKNIEDLKEELEIWKRKISFMRKLDY